MKDDESVDNATTFRKSDVPATNKRKYDRLWKANRPEWKGCGGWQSEEHLIPKDKSNVLDAIGPKLSLTSYQKSRAQHIIGSISDETFRAYKTSLVILCICGLVGREDGRDYHPNNLKRDSATGHVKQFTDIAESVASSHSELYSCWEKVRRQL